MRTLLLGLLAASLGAGHSLAQAQVSAPLREQLLASEVVVRDAQVYAMASGVQRGTWEGSQDWLVTRAMRSMAYKLCAFEPAPGRRLNAGLQGVTLLSAEAQGQELVVIIQAPVQKPLCKVTVVAPPPVPVPADVPRTADNPLRGVDASEPRASDILIRKFGGEY